MKHTHSSISALHQRWAKLENEHHELAMMIAEVGIRSPDLATAARGASKALVRDIEAVIAEIRHGSPTTIGHIVALLDVVLEHETDLACDIANDG